MLGSLAKRLMTAAAAVVVAEIWGGWLSKSVAYITETLRVIQ